MQISRRWAIVILGIPAAFLAAFFLVPFLLLVVSSFRSETGGWSLANYARIVADGHYANALWLTTWISFEVTLLTIVLGYPLAYFMTFSVRRPALRRALYITVLVPLFTSSIVQAFGWIVLFGRNGAINKVLLASGLIEKPLPLLYSEPGIVIGLGYVLFPFAVIIIGAVLQNLDQEWVRAARDLGAGPFRAFWLVTFPLSLPGVLAACLIVFTLSVSAYVTPAVLSGGKHLLMSMLIYQQYSSAFNYGLGAALAVTLLLASFVIIAGLVFTMSRQNRRESRRA